MNFDIVIVGAGMIGLSLNAALKHSNLKIAIIDRASISNNTQDSRGLALTPTSYNFFNNIGIWQNIISFSSKIKQVHISTKGRFAKTRLLASNINLDALGYVVPFSDLENNLKSIKNNNTSFFCPEEIVDATLQENFWQLKLKNTTINTKLLIGADGSNSIVRKIANIDSNITDYNQSAIISNIKLLDNHNNIAYERFVDNGTIAMLPFGNKLMKFVWSLNTGRAVELIKYNNKNLLNLIQQQFGNNLGKFQNLTTPVLIPLKNNNAQQLTSNRIALIGNAANTIHPIAAQGLNLGIRDVASLIDLIENSADPGNPENLQKYAAWRKQDHSIINNITNNLATGFYGKNIAIAAVDLIPTLKRKFIKQMCGLNNNLPRLCRG